MSTTPLPIVRPVRPCLMKRFQIEKPIGDAPRARLPLLGYAAVGPWALRHDVYESAQALARRGRSDRVRGLLGALESEAPAIVAALGGRRRAGAR